MAKKLRNRLSAYALPGMLNELRAAVDAGILGVNARTEAAGESLLHCAAFANQLPTAKYLLERGADANQGNEVGYTPLMAAARQAQCEMVRLLVDHGADVNAATTNSGDTPLICALMESFPPTDQVGNGMQLTNLSLLLERGADPNVATLTGTTPLILAAWRGRQDAVDVLLRHGADRRVTDGKGKTAAALAAERGFPDLANHLNS